MIDRTGNGKWSKWIENYCPECETPIKLPKQIRCDFCKVLFEKEMTSISSIWKYVHCPECNTAITRPKQIRCDFCKVLFDWEEE